MRTPPWLQSLIPRLQSLQSLLSRSLSRLLPPCPRRPNPRRPHHSRSKNKAKPPKTVPAEEAVPAPAPEPAQPPKAPPPEPAPSRAQPEASQPPAEPVRMTPAQERALRYMQRQDRYMELLARNTHEL